jgi:2-(3-amino-3-carboxypropyl)histidine synthase
MDNRSATITTTTGNRDTTDGIPHSESANSGKNQSTTSPTTTPSSSNVTKPAGQRRVIRRKHRDKAGNAAAPAIDPILLQETLEASNLPKAYSFEIPKTVQRILTLQAKHIALQMPEGLLLYATVLSDVLKRLVAASSSSSSHHQQQTLQVSILGDVTYGACCVDDLGAQALGCDLLVHYGHSCLVQIQHTAVPCLYVFVEITIDVSHLVECLHLTLKEDDSVKTTEPTIYLLGTIQFRHALSEAQELLQSEPYNYNQISIPQAKPLSPGEVLGCTSPVLTQSENDDNSKTIVLFVADGRFHLESTMISNPHISHFYRYDPYSKAMTEESYQHGKMKSLRYKAVQQAAAENANVFGIILGTLGRQGNPALLTRIQTQIQKHQKRYFVMLASEITPAKLALFQDKVDVWVQIACPRLSVDWGHALSTTKPVLNPYELFVCLGATEWKDQEPYPMDYYSQAGGPWSNYHAENKDRQHSMPL